MKPITYLFFGISVVLFVLLFGCLYEGGKDKPESTKYSPNVSGFFVHKGEVYITEGTSITIKDAEGTLTMGAGSWSSLSVGVPSNTFTIFDRRTNKRVKVNYTQDTIYYNDNIYVKQ